MPREKRQRSIGDETRGWTRLREAEYEREKRLNCVWTLVYSRDLNEEKGRNDKKYIACSSVGELSNTLL